MESLVFFPVADIPISIIIVVKSHLKVLFCVQIVKYYQLVHSHVLRDLDAGFHGNKHLIRFVFAKGLFVFDFKWSHSVSNEVDQNLLY